MEEYESMSTEETLTLVAGILFIIGFIIDLIFGALAMLAWLPMQQMIAMMEAMMPGSSALLLPALMVLMIEMIVLFVIGFIGLIFGILCLRWRSDTTGHKTGLIIIGIIAIILGCTAIFSLYAAFGFIPGILALIAGIMS
jgi:hypothetical protein